MLQFSLDMKRRAYYTNSEAMEIYTKVDDFVAALALPPSSGTAGQTPIHTTTVGKWKFMHTQKIYVVYALGGIATAISLAFLVLLVRHAAPPLPARAARPAPPARLAVTRRRALPRWPPTT